MKKIKSWLEIVPLGRFFISSQEWHNAIAHPMRPPDETLIFLHLPKAGGMTLHQILARFYPRDAVYTFDSKKPHEAVAHFKTLPEPERGRYRLLKGHILFGLHAALPNPATYLTMLRDPVERVISQFYYAKSLPDHYLYARLHGEKLSLYDYAAKRVTPEISNQQTAMLAGHNLRQGSPTRETLETAKQNLQTHFRVVGLTEEFDTTLLLLRRAFDFPAMYYLRENTTEGKPNHTQIDPRARTLLRELNELDMELYKFARELFAEQCRAYGAGLHADLARFRMRNRIYQRVLTRPTRAWQQLRAQR